MANDTVDLGSDGQLVVKLGPWAKEKLFYIDRYCNIFNTGMKGRWETRCYIDLFAGPGRCLIRGTDEEVDGSPLVALKCRTPFTHYFFNDENQGFVNALKARTATCAEGTPIRFFSMDCNKVIRDLKATLPSQSLDFCFIDPFGWEIRFSSVEELTKGRRMDIAITFHSGQVKRFANMNPDAIDQFMGQAGFSAELTRVISQRPRQATRYLLSAYAGRLRGIGYAETKDYVLVTREHGRPFYHLLFASKHRRGADFWSKISERSSSGQLRLFNATNN